MTSAISIASHNTKSLTPWILYSLFACAVALFCGFFDLFVPLTLLLIVSLVLCLQDPVAGIVALIFMHLFIIHTTKEITPGEMGFVLFLAIFLGVWMVKSLIGVLPRQIEHTQDWLLAMYIGFVIFSIFPALINRNDLVLWAREVGVMTVLLLYFPIKESVRTRNQIIWVTAAFATLALIIGTQDLLNYKTLVLRATFLWEIQASRQSQDEPLFMTMVIIAVAFLVHTRSAWVKIVALGTVAFFGAALLITFSRAYWFGAAAGLATILIIVPKGKKVAMLLYGGISTMVAAAVILFFFGEYTDAISGSIGKRFMTVERITADLSIRSRLDEYAAAIRSGLSQPILGHGFGATFFFHDIIPNQLVERNYIHNSYVYLFFKLGLVGLGLYISFFVSIVWRLWQNVKRTTGWLLALNTGMLAATIALSVVSMSSPQVLHKNSVLVFTLCAGLSMATVHFLERENLNSK